MGFYTLESNDLMVYVHSVPCLGGIYALPELPHLFSMYLFKMDVLHREALYDTVGAYIYFYIFLKTECLLSIVNCNNKLLEFLLHQYYLV